MKDVIKIKGSPDNSEGTTEETNWRILAVFEDGTQLEIVATVPNMPLNDMTPREVRSLYPVEDDDGNLISFEDRGMESDGGMLEMWRLQMQTSAYKMLEKIFLELEARLVKDND